MAGVLKTAARSRAVKSGLIGALKEAAITALVAFLLFGPIVGFKLENTQTDMVLVYRFGLAIALSLAMGGIRLVLDLFLWRKIWSIGGPPASAQRRQRINFAWAGAIAVYSIGGVFFILPDVREWLTDTSASLFPLRNGSLMPRLRSS